MSTPTYALGRAKTYLESERPFGNDLFDRTQTAERLKGYIDRLKDGAVIGIDAPWGEGKTWFGKNFCQLLKSDHLTIYLDAFENDYLDDPFVLIATELSELFKDSNDASVVKRRAIDVAKAIAPIGAKLIVNTVARVITGVSDLTKEVSDAIEDAGEKIAESSEKLLEKRFEEVFSQRKAIRDFKSALSSVVANVNHPVVVFIDELDRCKPEFAVTLVERLKHLFDLPNLVFVLLMNRAQMEASIKGYYGSETDASGYLSKFVNLWFELPRITVHGDKVEGGFVDRFIDTILLRFEISESDKPKIDRFKGVARLWAHTWHFSPREIEHMCTLFILCDLVTNGLMAYLIALKVKKPNVFARIRYDKNENVKQGTEMADLGRFLLSPNDSIDRFPNAYFMMLGEMHEILGGIKTIENAIAIQKNANWFMGHAPSLERAFEAFAAKIDFSVRL